MENNFNAKGQLLFVEPEWITGKTCLFTVSDMRDYIKGMMGLTKIRKEFLKTLEAEGFVITHEKHNTKDDIIYLNMNNEALCNEEINVDLFKKIFDQRMFEAGGEKLNYPHSLPMEDYFKNPFYPAVFKNESTNGGEDKFLIENQDQVEVIKKFYNKYKNIEQYAIAFNCSIFQQLIETPTDHQTYMRVLMSASGDVLGASLKYSRVSESKRAPRGLFEKYFFDESSEYYLNSKGMFNYYSGGGNINLSQLRFSYEEKEILEMHGINSENPSVPASVLEVAASIACKCNKELGIICGIDFIMDRKTNIWYYLEVQAFPAIDEWAIAKKKKIPNYRNINDYVKLNALDLEVRHEALMMFMKKKQERENLQKLTRNKK